MDYKRIIIEIYVERKVYVKPSRFFLISSEKNVGNT